MTRSEKNNIDRIWNLKLIKDLGKERFKEIFSKSIEGIKINPFILVPKNLSSTEIQNGKS